MLHAEMQLLLHYTHRFHAVIYLKKWENTWKDPVYNRFNNVLAGKKWPTFGWLSKCSTS